MRQKLKLLDISIEAQSGREIFAAVRERMPAHVDAFALTEGRGSWNRFVTDEIRYAITVIGDGHRETRLYGFTDWAAWDAQLAGCCAEINDILLLCTDWILGEEHDIGPHRSAIILRRNSVIILNAKHQSEKSERANLYIADEGMTGHDRIEDLADLERLFPGIFEAPDTGSGHAGGGR